jgi:ubiquinone biosynthesis protein
MRASQTPATNSQHSGVVAALPRRQFYEVSDGGVPLSQMKFVSFQPNRGYAFKRLLTWLKLLISFFVDILKDIGLGRDSIERRAANLRRVFEREGGSFVKLGKHLSMRVDFMPWSYCNELSRMTDHMKPFPVTQAISIIERSTGKPLSATFSQFDPAPVLSTSVANTYQAILLSGVKVVVKVRRPGIGEQFMADLQAFDWLLFIAEFLTIFRPGFSKGMREDFRNLLIEELDFIQEARRQDAFRRAAAKTEKKFFSAPRVYLDLSGEEVVVNEFAAGMWLWELIAGIETGNETVLAQAREMNIDPCRVAKRLLWVNNWSWEENLFFHADPYPTNIIIGRNSKIYLINFSSTGTLSRSKRQALHQNLYYAAQRDPQNMARSSLVLMEPIPPIDVMEFTQEMESHNWQMVYALEAEPESLSWQERTSVIQWIGMVRLARKYGIIMDIQVLRMLRATLLIESIAVRLHPKINIVDQYWKFDQFRAEQARRRVTNSLFDQLDGKTNERLVIRADRILHTIEDLIQRARHMLTLPSVNFNSLMSKWSFAFYILFRYLGQILIVTGLAAMIGYAIYYFNGLTLPSPQELSNWIITNPFYLLSLLVLTFINGRTVLFRMDDKEIPQ